MTQRLQIDNRRLVVEIERRIELLRSKTASMALLTSYPLYEEPLSDAWKKSLLSLLMEGDKCLTSMSLLLDELKTLVEIMDSYSRKRKVT